MVDSSFVDAIINAASTEVVEIAGKQYATREVFNAPAPKEWLDETLSLTTLTGIVEFCTTPGMLSELAAVVHVESFGKVSVLSKVQGTFKKRNVLATSSPIVPEFTFGRFYPHSEFMIALQSKFIDEGDRKVILRILGTVREELIKTSMDDGTTQKVAASSGIVLQSEVSIPNPVILQPYRTFLEVDQPVSSFVLRVQAGKPGALPEAALFEADGGMWRSEAMERIQKYLADHITTIPVIR